MHLLKDQHSAFRVLLLAMMLLRNKDRFEPTKEISLKKQPHAVSTCVKRSSQCSFMGSFTNYCNRCIKSAIKFCHTIQKFQQKYLQV